jgi:hypothetical protein
MGAAPCPALLRLQPDKGDLMIEFPTLSTKEEKCIQKAKKKITDGRKWGHWLAALYLFYSIVLITAGIAGIYFITNFVEQIAGIANPANPNQQMVDAAKQGLALGLIFGCVIGLFFFKGIFYLFEAMNLFRGDITNNLLIKYHEGILEFMQNKNDGQIKIADDATEQVARESNDR